MTAGKFNKTESDQILLFLNEAQRLVVQVRSSMTNTTLDIAAINPDEADRPDPLRLPEVIIVICVLLLWCGSIFIFIRHSELLRIRHRDLPYRSSIKPPMNLNHITVVHRTSDMVIHSKPRISSGVGLSPPRYSQDSDEYQKPETIHPPSRRYMYRQEREINSFDSNTSGPVKPHHPQLLDPYMIPSNVRKSLLDLHRKSMENLSSIRYTTLSYSTNDVSTCKQSDDQQSTVDERCIQESPV